MTRPLRPIVVVGSGLAGMCTALAAAPHPVLLLGRGGCASALAQGGIAAAVGAGDSAQAHLADTLAAGAFHNDVAAARALVVAAPAAVAWLQARGVGFDREQERLRLGREGGHRRARIVHAGGDRSGELLVAALRHEVRAAPHVEHRDDIDVDALLLQGERVAGVRAVDPDGRAESVQAAAVVLATGGLAALFGRTTHPGGSDGAGLALALAAGARMRDLEFVQFHPTALACAAARLSLITEALRGAGARLCDAAGRALMAGLHPLGDLAPRDVVARRVWRAQRDGPVWLDATGLPGGWHEAFPNVMAACLQRGIDPRTAPIPVTAAAHFHMGGIATSIHGVTSVAGLYAVGEVACSGVHGANRLASNSLLECVVMGRRLGAQLASLARQERRRRARHRWITRGAGLSAQPLSLLREALWRAAGPVRSLATLTAVRSELASLAPSGWQARLACALLDAAMRRPVSLGAHWREDVPAG